jgi:hypothetical protein
MPAHRLTRATDASKRLAQGKVSRRHCLEDIMMVFENSEGRVTLGVTPNVKALS